MCTIPSIQLYAIPRKHLVSCSQTTVLPPLFYYDLIGEQKVGSGKVPQQELYLGETF